MNKELREPRELRKVLRKGKIIIRKNLFLNRNLFEAKIVPNLSNISNFKKFLFTDVSDGNISEILRERAKPTRIFSKSNSA